MGPLRHRDFRMLWIGAFFSFTGGWVQKVAQGWLVYDLTHDEAKLALVLLFNSIPVALIAPFSGAFVDRISKRRMLITCQVALSLTATYMFCATFFGFVQYWQILLIAMINGLTETFEMPTRQSIISRVVPRDELAAAIPLNAMSFNISRLFGPALGGVLLGAFGPAVCYGINAISFFGLVFSALTIRADLSAIKHEETNLVSFAKEGIRHTLSDTRLRTLFIMEAVVSSFGVSYLALMPAIAKEMLGLDKRGLGFAFTAVGVGSVFGLLLLTWIGNRSIRVTVIRVSMTTMAIALVLIGFTGSALAAFPLFAIVGLCTMFQFNGTNTMFQLLSPERLRGRVLGMHVWALAGVGPFGGMLLGWLARETSLPWALWVGGGMVLMGSLWGWSQRNAFHQMATTAFTPVPATSEPKN